MDLPRGGGPRPRRVQPLPGGDLPDDGVRLARRHGAEDDDPAGGRGGARCRAAGHRRGVSFEPELSRGWVGEELAAEFPQLALLHTTLAARTRRTPVEVRERLRAMSDRFTGSRAVQVRRQPVPWAYRVFFRQIGIAPDAPRPPPEAAAVGGMRGGAFASRNLVDD